MLLAKPDTSLVEHLKEVTQFGVELAKRLGLKEPLRTKVIIACALHDIGKATEDFQIHVRGERKKAYPHALASFPFIFVLEGLINHQLGIDPLCFEATAAVLTHHSPLSPQLYKGYEKPEYHPELGMALKNIWELLQEIGIQGLPALETFWQLTQSLLKDSPAALLDAPQELKNKRTTLRGIFQALPTVDFASVKAVLHLADWLTSAKKPKLELLFLKNGSKAIARHTKRLKAPLRQFQKEALSSQSEVLWLRAPTGTGKTEALLLWAGNAERVIYLLPTQATTNAMWLRLRKIYGDDNVALAHGRASYMLRRELDEDPLDVRLLGSVFAKPITVATLDQYLLAHLHGRHWEERRTLARKATVLLDEIHSYEPYTLGLLLETLDREPPERLALASATLPKPLLNFFPQGKLIEAEQELWKRKRHMLELCEGTFLDNGVKLALERANKNEAVLVVANTVRDAQEFYIQIKEAGWNHCELLHSRFILRDRQRKEKRVCKPKPGIIFVATQVVEVSLDISYDVLITELAPMDALVQRMGRINRKGVKPPAPVFIYPQWSEGAQRIYGREILEKSSQIIERLPLEPTDADLAQATHELYEFVVNTYEWQEELRDGRDTLKYVQQVLGCYTIDLSDEDLRTRFTARRGVISVEVLPAQFLEEAYAFKESGKVWKLVELLIPVPIWWLKQLNEAFFGISDLKVIGCELPYDYQLGLRIPKGEENKAEVNLF